MGNYKLATFVAIIALAAIAGVNASDTNTDPTLLSIQERLGDNFSPHIVAYVTRPAAQVVFTDTPCPEPVPDPNYNGGHVAFLLYQGDNGALPGCYIPGPFRGVMVKWANGMGDNVEASDMDLTALGKRETTQPTINESGTAVSSTSTGDDVEHKYSDSSFDWDHDAPMSDNEYDIGSVITECKINRGKAKAKLAIFYKKLQREHAEGRDPTNGNGGNSIWAMGFTCAKKGSGSLFMP